MLVGICQLNPTVGALAENADAIIDAYRSVVLDGARLAVFGELAVCGYPPEDLVLKHGFLLDCRAQVDRIAAVTGDCVAVVGFPEASDGYRYNSAAICRQGVVETIVRKHALPNYDVFDEDRWFEPGARHQPLFDVDGTTVGVSICEDIWVEGGPTTGQASAGATLLVNVNGSPFRAGRQDDRLAVVSARSRETGVPIVYVNQVGGQDDLIFDGGSVVVGPEGVRHAAPRFSEWVRVVDVTVVGDGLVAGDGPDPVGVLDETWGALVLGTRDYVEKNGFSHVVVGLSGGVDSAVVAAIAVDALGLERVHGVLMPSRYSSPGSVDDAVTLCSLLGIEHRIIPVEPAHAAFGTMLSDSFGGREPGLTDENLQSRIRGVTLMALSNLEGWLVLTTGNKSETAVGYSTLYGDTAGALAVIKDVWKTEVYDLCRWRNAGGDGVRIPEAVLTKAPSAELRPDQRDDQSLPPYEILDPLLAAYIDNDLTVAELVAAGHDAELVARICRLVDLAEYKRRQTPPGLRVSAKAFGRDRRLPITNRYR